MSEQVAEQLLSKGWHNQLPWRHEPHQLVHGVEAQLAALAGAPIHNLAALGRTRSSQLGWNTACRGCMQWR